MLPPAPALLPQPQQRCSTTTIGQPARHGSPRLQRARRSTACSLLCCSTTTWPPPASCALGGSSSSSSSTPRARASGLRCSASGPAAPWAAAGSRRAAGRCSALGPDAGWSIAALGPDALAALLAAAAGYGWVKIFDRLASAGVLDQKLSRKLVHSTAGPLLLLTWPFFSDAPTARVLAAAVPCLNMIRLLLVGGGVVSDPGLVKSVSRAGERRELLKGPTYYCVVLVASTLLFWRDHPAGLVAVSMMCGGDGLADIVGRRWGSAKLPWNASKSWAGSAAMMLGGGAMAGALLATFCGLGYLPLCASPWALAGAVAAVCAACTVVESLPVNQWLDDNISVPGVAVAGSLLLVAPLATAAAQAQQALPLLQLAASAGGPPPGC